MPCPDEVYIEAAKKNVEDNMHDEHVNEILRYWSFAERKFYSHVMLQQIDDEKHTTKDDMWQQSTYKTIFE